ncbi:MAG: nucleoside recognition domain-containing protein [Desulfoplanes sp.]|nr:nucleoside recognition domain-containing protein [Desulfoplanes sp.]
MHYQPNTQDTAPEQPAKPSSHRSQKHKKSILIPALVLGSITLALAFLAWIDPTDTGISWGYVYTGLIKPLSRLLIYLGIGLFAGQAMESLGWAEKLALPARPLMRLSGLKDESGVAFVTAFASNLAANTLLMGYYKEGRITKKEMTLTYLLNTGLPVFLVHLPTTFFVIAPLVKTAGLIYLGICLTAAGLKSALVLIYCRISLGRSVPASNHATTPPVQDKTKKSPHRGLIPAFKKRFARIVLYTAPIYVIIFLLNHLGFFEYLRTSLAHSLSLSFFPVESASVVIVTLAAEFTSGAAAAGALLDGGILTIKQTVLALIIGTIAATPIRALRHQLPSQAGIFSPSLALKQLCLSQALRIGTIIIVATPYLVWF